jgi:hypothetical protein
MSLAESVRVVARGRRTARVTGGAASVVLVAIVAE